MTDIDASGGAEPLAIVGMACRVPGAGNVAQFWENLVEGVESFHHVTPEEHLAADGDPADFGDPDFVPVAAFLDDAGHFDAVMFGMTPSEAEMRDPHHRLFLELAHTALADSGYDPRRCDGDIGVFAGSGEDSYQWLYVRRNLTALIRSGPIGLAINSHPDYVSTLASFKLGLRGPSMTVHTACSTSLVVVHLACEALRNGECDMALAGAVNLELPLGRGYLWSEGGPTSKDGHCRAFDAGATGTVWSSGGAVVVLKRLGEAIADGDDIRAVILGDAVNNDGDTKVGFTAPSQQGQAAVIAQALSVAGVDPRTIGYVEAHGTGTILGDPIEVAALSSVYQRRTQDRGWCAIGSVKTNVGHLGPAAGVTGLIKATLAVRNGIIPPSLHFETPNPQIDFGANPFFVNAEPSVWASDDGPRRAAVSSFGMGGTNAHVIIEHAPPRQRRTAEPRGWHLLQLSARTETALAASAENLASHLQAAPPGPDRDLADVAFTLRAGRQQLPQRLAVVAADEQDAARALRDQRRWISGTAGREIPQPVLVFPGQGAQYPGMGSGIYAREKVYRDAVDECCGLLAGSALGDDRVAVLRGLLTSAGGDEDSLRQTALAQPALFIVGYALTELWQSFGVTPRAMIGHSIGEYVAAASAGVFRLADALRVVAARGELMQSAAAGVMIAVQLDETELREILPEGACIAAVNGPAACVVSGPSAVVGELAARLRETEVSVRELRTSHAFHSALMDPVLPAFRDVVAAVELRPPRIPFASNRTGDWISDQQATDPSYWAGHLRDTVRFGDCVATVAGRDGLFLECGPGRQLCGLIRMLRKGHTALPSLAGQGQAGQDLEMLATAAGQLWVTGYPLSAEAGAPGRRVPLPTYPWERRRYWVSPDPAAPGGAAAAVALRPGARSAPGERFEVPVWRQRPPSGPHQPPARVLVLGTGDDFVAGELASRGSDVVRVHRADRYGRDGSGSYQVRPASRADYEALFADLAADGSIPAHIVHCWTLPDAPAAGAQATWLAQDDGFFSALALVQALAGTVPEGGVRLDVVTAGTQEAVGQDLSRPEHATLAGAVKILPLEFPWLTARHIDADSRVMAGLGRGGQGPRAGDLIDEICAAQATDGAQHEHLVALRNGRRWHRQFEEVRVPGAADRADGERNAATLRDGGVYLITGGLGGIGITLAEELATRCRARLALVSRHGLPERDHWDDAASPARVRRAIAAIRRMEQAGAQVRVIAADVTDAAAAGALRDEVLSRYGRVDGIIHAAGVPGGGMAEIKDRATAEDVLRPKVAGTLALRDAFAGQRLDFVVLCSSVLAIAGSFGQVDYSAANAFLDAHAGGDHGWNATVVSVNWGAWLEVGMAAEITAPAAFRALQQGQHMLPVKHGLLSGRYSAGDDASVWCSGKLAPDTHWVLNDHRFTGHDDICVLPGTAYLEIARCAFEECYPAPEPGRVVELRDVVFTQSLTVRDGASADLRVILTPAADGIGFEVRSVAGSTERVHAYGSAAWIPAGEETVTDLNAIRARCSLGEISRDSAQAQTSGLIKFGPHWDNLVRAYQGQGEALALLEDEYAGADPYPWTIQPAVLDQAMASGDGGREFLPFGYGRVIVRQPLPRQLWSHRRYRDAESADMFTADVSLYDESGHEVLRAEDFSMRKVDAATFIQPPAAAAADGQPPTDAISPATGAAAFRRLVDAGIAPQVVISAKPIDEMIANSYRVDYQAVEQELAAPGKAGPAAAPAGGAGTPRTEREQMVAQILGDLLGVPPVDSDADFFGLGGNSLIAVQLIAFLRKRFGVRLPMRRFFSAPTPAGIAALIDELSPSAGPGAE